MGFVTIDWWPRGRPVEIHFAQNRVASTHPSFQERDRNDFHYSRIIQFCDFCPQYRCLSTCANWIKDVAYSYERVSYVMVMSRDKQVQHTTGGDGVCVCRCVRQESRRKFPYNSHWCVRFTQNSTCDISSLYSMCFVIVINRLGTMWWRRGDKQLPVDCRPNNMYKHVTIGFSFIHNLEWHSAIRLDGMGMSASVCVCVRWIP